MTRKGDKMKKLIGLLILIIMCSQISFAHGQNTHKYMTVKAYELLVRYFGNIPGMGEHIGSTSSYYNGDYPFQRHFITTGAYREDEEDLVFGFDGYLLSGWDIDIDDWLVSITHFWDADDGDTPMNYFVATVPPGVHTPLGTFPNSYQKLLKFAYPTKYWEIKYKMDPGEAGFRLSNGNMIYITHCGGVGFKYNSLIELYKTGKAWVTGYYRCPLADWVSCNYEVVLGEGWRDALVWEILGRMCHLVQDLSVPAHAHKDEHGYYPEFYEDYMSSSSNYTLTNNEFLAIPFINPYEYQPSNPLHFLMYTLQQVTDHYASCGNDFNGWGDDNLSGNRTSTEINFINTNFPLNNLGGPNTPSEAVGGLYHSNVRSKIYPFGIQATAGLLYWFALECDLIQPPIPLHVTINGATHPPSYSTSAFTSTVTGAQGGVTYQWEQMYQCCTDDYNCGVYFYRGSNSAIDIYNTNKHYYLRLTVWDGLGRSAVDYHFVTLETCIGGGGGNGCPTLSFEQDSTSDSGGGDENPLLISSTTYPTEDVVDYYLIQSEIAPIHGEIHFNIREPATEHTWLDQVQLIEIETNPDELVAVTDNGEIINYLESTSPSAIMLNDTIDVTAALESRDGDTLHVNTGDILSMAIGSNGPDGAVNVVAIDGFVTQKNVTADILFVFPGGGDEDVGDLFLRPNASMSALNFGGLGAGTLKLVFHQEATIDFLSLINDLNTADIETLEMTAAVHSVSGSVLSLVNGVPDQHYAEIYPDQDISFTFTEGDHSLSKIQYVLKTVGRYETDTTDAINKLAKTNEEIIIPKENKLYDNYPNPFNPTTQIKFAVKGNGLVNLKVYDALGKEVAVLVNETKQAGTYTVNFDASYLSSGIYFYTISAKNFRQSKKMLLIK